MSGIIISPLDTSISSADSGIWLGSNSTPFSLNLWIASSIKSFIYILPLAITAPLLNIYPSLLVCTSSATPELSLPSTCTSPTGPAATSWAWAWGWGTCSTWPPSCISSGAGSNSIDLPGMLLGELSNCDFVLSSAVFSWPEFTGIESSSAVFSPIIALYCSILISPVFGSGGYSPFSALYDNIKNLST